MQHFRSVHSTVHAGVASLCFWVLQHMDKVQAYIADYRQIAIPIILAGLAFLFRTSDTLATVIIENIPLFSWRLRRFLMRKEYIEGDWPLVVVDMQTLRPLYFGFLTIDFRGGQHYVHGDDWNPDGTHAFSYHSVQSLCRNHMLQYWYEQGASMHQPEMRGYTEMYFFPVDTVAQRHAGRFLDPQHTHDIRFYAEKHHYRPFQWRLAKPDRKLETAQAVWQKIEPRLGYLRSRTVSADFL